MRQPQRAPDLRRRRRPLRVRLMTPSFLAVFASLFFSSQCKLKRPLPPPRRPAAAAAAAGRGHGLSRRSRLGHPRVQLEMLCQAAPSHACLYVTSAIAAAGSRNAAGALRFRLAASSQPRQLGRVAGGSARRARLVAPRSRRQTPAEGFASPTLVAPVPEPADSLSCLVPHAPAPLGGMPATCLA